MALWFTADTHFGHTNIIKYCERPWSEVGAMNEALIENWNARVRPGDTVWHLGDVSFHADPAKFLRRLNGNIHVCYGNHDKPNHLKRAVEDGVIRWCGSVKYLRWEGHKIFVSHYAHRVWPKSHHGSSHLYGHSHGWLPEVGRSMDVGVDTEFAKYFPIHIEQILNRLNERPFSLHHELRTPE